MRTIGLSLMAVVLSACSGAKFSSSTNELVSLRQQKNRVEDLNELSKRRKNLLKIHFDRLDHANMFTRHDFRDCAISMVYPPPPLPPECRDNAKELVSIGGQGSFSGRLSRRGGDVLASFDPLQIEVTYDASLQASRLKEETCLKKAEQALSENRQFDIVGKASFTAIDIPPIYGGGYSGGSPEPLAVEQLHAQGAAIADGVSGGPVFEMRPWALGLVLKSIESCSIGEPVVERPIDPEPPIVCEVISSSGVSQTTRCLPPIKID